MAPSLHCGPFPSPFLHSENYAYSQPDNPDLTTDWSIDPASLALQTLPEVQHFLLSFKVDEPGDVESVWKIWKNVHLRKLLRSVEKQRV